MDEIIRETIEDHWKTEYEKMEQQTIDIKASPLPLARIKKVMKTDEVVKQMMISQEVPVLFAKACELFIIELTKRGWIFTQENKRRTLQKVDVAAAITKSEMYDFLIDIVPREEKRMDYSQYQQAYGMTQEQILRLSMLSEKE
jgi:histone H3/H4